MAPKREIPRNITSWPYSKVNRVTTPHNGPGFCLSWNLGRRLGAVLSVVGVGLIMRSEALIRCARAHGSGWARLGKRCARLSSKLTCYGRRPARPRVGVVLTSREAGLERREGFLLLLLLLWLEHPPPVLSPLLLPQLLVLPLPVRPLLELPPPPLLLPVLPVLELPPPLLPPLVLPLCRGATLPIGRGARNLRGPDPALNGVQSNRAGMVLEGRVKLLPFAAFADPAVQSHDDDYAQKDESRDAGNRRAYYEKSIETRPYAFIPTGGEYAVPMRN